MRIARGQRCHCLVKAVLIGRRKPLVFGECCLNHLLAERALTAPANGICLCHLLYSGRAMFRSAQPTHGIAAARPSAYSTTHLPCLLLSFLTPDLSLVLPCKLLFQVVRAYCSHRVPVGPTYETCKDSCQSPIWEVGTRLGERHNTNMHRPL